MTTHTLQQTLANAWHAHTSRIVCVSLSLVILVGGAFGYHNATAPRLAQGPSMQPAASSTYVGPLAQTGTWNRLAAGADESTRDAIGQEELAYAGALLSEEQLQHYLAVRQAGSQACRPVGQEELAYAGALLSAEQLQRYVDMRQCPPDP